MKSQIRTMAVAVLAALASLPMLASAQTTVLYARVKVPFAFNYGTQHMPAGSYVLTLNDGVLTISGYPATAMALTDVSYDPAGVSASQVVFNKYGHRYFLEEVTIDGAGAEISIPQSETERLYSGEWAINHQAPSRTTLALLNQPAR
jgi:hypothetical protein